MNTADGSFRQLDDLVLSLKGLVFVRELRQRDQADENELELYNAEIERVRDRLADLVRNGGGAINHPAAA
jgi:hypothetical protein